MGSENRSTVDWETASRCPICGEPGREVKVIQIPYRLGARGHILMCDNIERCRWGEEKLRWIVQVNANGTIPVRQAGEKQYPKLPPINEEQFMDNLNQQLDAEVKEHTEVRNPRSGM